MGQRSKGLRTKEKEGKLRKSHRIMEKGLLDFIFPERGQRRSGTRRAERAPSPSGRGEKYGPWGRERPRKGKREKFTSQEVILGLSFEQITVIPKEEEKNIRRFPGGITR